MKCTCLNGIQKRLTLSRVTNVSKPAGKKPVKQYIIVCVYAAASTHTDDDDDDVRQDVILFNAPSRKSNCILDRQQRISFFFNVRTESVKTHIIKVPEIL